MAAKKDTAEAGKVTKDALSRKAYGNATAALRVAHRDEFDLLLDTAYEALGMTSPRVARSLKAEEKYEARVAANEKREARRVAKIAKMEAELAALKGVAQDPIF